MPKHFPSIRKVLLTLRISDDLRLLCEEMLAAGVACKVYVVPSTRCIWDHTVDKLEVPRYCLCFFGVPKVWLLKLLPFFDLEEEGICCTPEFWKDVPVKYRIPERN